MENNENEKKFDKLFQKALKVGFRNLTKEERNEYFRLQYIHVNAESKRIFYEILESGDYRI